VYFARLFLFRKNENSKELEIFSKSFCFAQRSFYPLYIHRILEGAIMFKDNGNDRLFLPYLLIMYHLI